MKVKRNYISYIVMGGLVLVLLALSLVVLAAPGDLDTTFDTDGIVTTGIGGVGYNPVALQSDGKIIVAGTNGSAPNNDFAVARYNVDGSLDSSFGSGGTVTTNLGGNDIGKAIAIQSDGKLVVAGESNAPGNFDFAVVRYNDDGSLDTSFDGDGIATAAVGTLHDRADVVAIQSDGKIVVGGYGRGTTANDFAVVRFCADGSLDDGVNCGATGFGTGGEVMTDIGGNQDQIYGIALQSDGKIIVSGYSGPTPDYDFVLVRYCTDGSPDNGTNCGGSGFGTGGIVKTDVNGDDEFSYGLALQNDGKIVAAGYNAPTGMHNNVDVLRYNSDGSLDASFDSDGKVITDINVRDDYGYDVAMQYDGKIVVTGYTINPSSDQDFFVLRYESDGSLDTRFSGDGKVVTPIGAGTYDRARGVVIQTDGKILVAGVSGGSALARYNVAEVITETVGNGGTSSTLPDLAITNNSGSACDFTAKKIPVPPGGGAPDPGEMPIHWILSSTCSPVNVDLVFSYTDTELANGNGVSEANLVAFRHTGGSTWTNQGGVVNTAANTVSLTGVTTFSGWTIGDPTAGTPTAITLGGRVVQPGNGLGLVMFLTVSLLLATSAVVIVRKRQ